MAEARSSLLEEVRAVQHRPKGQQCSMKAVEEALSPEDLADLKAALEDPTVEGSAIVLVLQKRGFDIKAHTLLRHRRGGCSCA